MLTKNDLRSSNESRKTLSGNDEYFDDERRILCQSVQRFKKNSLKNSRFMRKTSKFSTFKRKTFKLDDVAIRIRRFVDIASTFNKTKTLAYRIDDRR